MAKKILCLRKGKQIFEDRCVAGQIFFSGFGADKEAEACLACIRQRKEAEIRAEYPDEITEAQEHTPPTSSSLKTLNYFSRTKKGFSRSTGKTITPPPVDLFQSRATQ